MAGIVHLALPEREPFECGGGEQLLVLVVAPPDGGGVILTTVVVVSSTNLLVVLPLVRHLSRHAGCCPARLCHHTGLVASLDARAQVEQPIKQMLTAVYPIVVSKPTKTMESKRGQPGFNAGSNCTGAPTWSNTARSAAVSSSSSSSSRSPPARASQASR